MNIKRWTLSFLILLLVAGANVELAGQDHGLNQLADEEQTSWYLSILPTASQSLNWNWTLPTTGGMQFWTDVQHFHGYRIQRNVYTGHYRLLDVDDVRQAWGTGQQCQQQLQTIATQKGLSPMRGKIVLVLHGLGRTRQSMEPLAEYIRRNSDMHVLNISYASTRLPLEEHAAALATIIERLPEAEEFYFVAHSMGNIVVRRWLSNQMTDPRCRRMVMLGPPNQGSAMARYFQDNSVFKLVTGDSGQQLSKNWETVVSELATPPFEFGVIAGALDQKSWLQNPLLDGTGDLFVLVDETKLAGATDFQERPLLHGTMMSEPTVLPMVLRFLQEGYFVSEEAQCPLPVGPRLSSKKTSLRTFLRCQYALCS